MSQNVWFQSEVRAFASRIERLIPNIPKDKKDILESFVRGEEPHNIDLSNGLEALLDKWEYLYLEDFPNA